MTRPDTTYELHISFAGEHSDVTKSETKAFLINLGQKEFVEGALDVDINHDYSNQDKDLYAEHGGNVAPISIYKYSKEELDNLISKLTDHFKDRISTKIIAIPTTSWTEGWKESFKPIETDKFFVRPPWENPVSTKHDIEIEPGMAFGTGQHMTTMLCLKVLGNYEEELKNHSLLDVGCGTGILAIAACKLGSTSVKATDIDQDAVRATLDNAERNQVKLSVKKGSVPSGGSSDLVVANILMVVLRKILPQLIQATRPNGLLIMSGILEEEADEMIAMATGQNLKLEDKLIAEGWACLCFRRIV